jgi:hypothetical protein
LEYHQLVPKRSLLYFFSVHNSSSTRFDSSSNKVGGFDAVSDAAVLVLFLVVVALIVVAADIPVDIVVLPWLLFRCFKDGNGHCPHDFDAMVVVWIMVGVVEDVRSIVMVAGLLSKKMGFEKNLLR